MKRRSFVLGAPVALLACKKAEERCPTCGMKIDKASSWRAELVNANGTVVSFDTPRCAFRKWRRSKIEVKTARVQEYYERAWKNAEDVRFMMGGDVVGPMGPDLVPVDPSRVTKFIQDHGAARGLKHDEIDAAILDKLDKGE